MLGMQHCIAWSDTAALCAGPLQHGTHGLYRRLHARHQRASGPERDSPRHRDLHHHHAPCPGDPLPPDRTLENFSPTTAVMLASGAEEPLGLCLRSARAGAEMKPTAWQRH